VGFYYYLNKLEKGCVPYTQDRLGTAQRFPVILIGDGNVSD